MQNTIEFTKIHRTINGNPRYVCHFSDLLTKRERNVYLSTATLNDRYKISIERAKKIGGKKYHTKGFGGGIVFTSYNIKETEKDVLDLLSGVK